MDWINDYEERPVIQAAKRCGVQWCPWMGDWFTSWSPRNDNRNAEGTWEDWVTLAKAILAHELTRDPSLRTADAMDKLFPAQDPIA